MTSKWIYLLDYRGELETNPETEALKIFNPQISDFLLRGASPEHNL